MRPASNTIQSAMRGWQRTSLAVTSDCFGRVQHAELIRLWMHAAQTASLCLVTTPAEELAVGVRSLLRPFRAVGVPVDEIGAPDRMCPAELLSFTF